MSDLKERQSVAIDAVIGRWYRTGLLRFSTHDDGSDDLLLRNEIVNALPDYEAAVEALHLLERTADHTIVRLDWDKVSRTERQNRLLELEIAAENARKVLARLREVAA